MDWGGRGGRKRLASYLRPGWPADGAWKRCQAERNTIPPPTPNQSETSLEGGGWGALQGQHF